MTEPGEKKVFISYSWSSKEHEQWVIDLANDLAENGIYVVFDKWDLKEGDDKYQFMERMVNDETVNKVIAICDKVYAEKADARKGGVGTESQIISQELYEKLDTSEQKFTAIITELNDDQKPYLPTFFKSRIYIDFSDKDIYEDSLEQLVRWIFDKPKFKRPETGKPPTYILEEDNKINLGTHSRFKATMNALMKNKEQSLGYCKDYFDFFVENLDKLRLDLSIEGELDDKVVEGIENLLPYRDEIIDLISRIARNYNDDEFYESIHKFLEKLLPYIFKAKDVDKQDQRSLDHFRFFINELFLYIVAVFLKNERFTQLNYLLTQNYFLEEGAGVDAGMYPYYEFNNRIESFELRKKRLNLNRPSLVFDYLKERATRENISFVEIRQADFILFIRAEIKSEDNYWFNWFPFSLAPFSSFGLISPKFDKFYRAESKLYFEKFKIVIGVNNVGELKQLMKEFNERKRHVPDWGVRRIDPSRLSNIDKLATK